LTGGPGFALRLVECASVGERVVAKNIFHKTVFSLVAFTAGIVWGIAAEASAAGLPLIGVFQG
jgi:hypothetical protein